MVDVGSVMSSQQLAKRFQSGDEEAFRQLHAQLDADLRAFVINRSPRGSDADGLVQDVWVKAWSSRASFSNQHFRGWVFQIARNLLIDTYRKGGRQPRTESWSDRDVAEVVREGQHDRIAALNDCLKSVGGEFVAVLRLRIEGLSTNEIASRMEIAEGTVFSRASRGEEQLRDCVERKLP